MQISLPRARLLLGIACGACAFASVLAITEPAGPGLDPDAVSYVMAATSLVRHHELRAPTYTWATPAPTVPLAHFPPGFSTAIAIPVALGMPAVQGARFVVATGAFVAMTTAVWLVAGAVGLFAAALAALLLFVSPPLVETHLAVLSEPLFVAMLVLTLAAMTRSRDRPLLYGSLAAAACMVRYAGVSASAAAALWALWSPGQPRSIRERLQRAIVAGLPSAIVFAAWVARSAGLDHSEIRDFGVYADLSDTLREGVNTVVQWLAPAMAFGALKSAVALIVLAAIAAVMVVAARARPDASNRSEPRRLLAACALLSATYIGTLFAARLTADPNIPFDARLLSPLLVFATIAIVVAVAVWWSGAPRWWRAVASVAIGAWVVGSFLVSRDDVSYALDVGVDFADAEWRDARVVEWARTEGRDRALFTNFPTALYFHAAREAWPLPETTSRAELRAFTDTLTRRNGLILVFTRPSEYVPPPEPLLRALPVHAIATFRDGSVWALDDSAAARGAAAPPVQR